MTYEAVSAWAAFVAEGIESVEEEGRTTPASNAPATTKPTQETEPEDVVGSPDTKRAPMVGPLSVNWPAFPRSTGTLSFLDLAAVG